MNPQYWLIEIEEGIRKIKSFKVPIGQITDNGLVKLITTLICKHALTDEEILETFCKKNTKKFKEYFKINKSSSNKGKVQRNFEVKCTNISIYVALKD